MKIIIWKADDYFDLIGQPRIDMDPAVVQLLEEPIPCVYGFNWDQAPWATVADIRIENDELVGELTWIEDRPDEAMNDEKWATLEPYLRFGGFYHDVQKVKVDPMDPNGEEQVTSCVLRAVSMTPKREMYYFPKIEGIEVNYGG